MGQSVWRGDGYDYVRQHYGVEVGVNDRVVINGRPAVILLGRDDQYLHFTTNGRNALKAHPTWRVEYPSRGQSVSSERQE